MKPNDFKIIFENTSNDIDVETLIGCLMHTSNIIQEVNRQLETDKKIEVKIKALERGSFEVHIELVESILQSIFSKDTVEYAGNIVGVVGGLYGLAKFLKGNRPKKTESKPDKNQIEITNIDGETTVFSNVVVNIFNDSQVVRENVAKQFKILEKNLDVDAFEFQSENITVEINKEEFDSISNRPETSEEENAPEVEILRDQKLQIIRPSFSRDLKWDFVYRGTKIAAKMEDTEMIKIIDAGEEFAKGDFMLVDIEETRFYDKDVDAFLITKDSYKILRYKQHIKTPRQSKFF